MKYYVICAWCGKVKNEERWQEVSSALRRAIEEHGATHAVCPDCKKEVEEQIKCQKI